MHRQKDGAEAKNCAGAKAIGSMQAQQAYAAAGACGGAMAGSWIVNSMDI
jgi:hypothetical protein